MKKRTQVIKSMRLKSLKQYAGEELYIDQADHKVLKEATSAYSDKFEKKLFPKFLTKIIMKRLTGQGIATRDNYTNKVYFDLNKYASQGGDSGELEQAILLAAYGEKRVIGFVLNKVEFIYNGELPKRIKAEIEGVIENHKDFPEAIRVAKGLLGGGYIRKLPYETDKEEEETKLDVGFEVKELIKAFFNDIRVWKNKSNPIGVKQFIYGLVWLVILAGVISFIDSSYLLLCLALESMFLLFPLMSKRFSDLGLPTWQLKVIALVNFVSFVVLLVYITVLGLIGGLDVIASCMTSDEVDLSGKRYVLFVGCTVLTVILQIAAFAYNIKILFSKTGTYSGDIEKIGDAALNHPKTPLKASGGSFGLPCAVANVDGDLYYKVGTEDAAYKAMRKRFITVVAYPIISVLATLSILASVSSFMFLAGDAMSQVNGSTSSTAYVVDGSDVDLLVDGDLVIVNGGFIDLEGADAEAAAESIAYTFEDEDIIEAYIESYATDDFSLGDGLYIMPVFAANIGDDGDSPFFAIIIYNSNDEDFDVTIGAYMYGDTIIDSGDEEYTLSAGEINCVSLGVLDGVDAIEGDDSFQIVVNGCNVYTVLADYVEVVEEAISSE